LLDHIDTRSHALRVQPRPEVALAPLTTLGIGGLATVMDLTDANDLPDIIDLVAAFDTKPVALGWGSNVLISDVGTNAPVLLIRTTGITARKENDQVLVTVQAGHALPDLVDFALAEHLIGIETLAGVPGTVGAMPIQNVGAYGQETADTLIQLTAWDWQTQTLVTLSAQDCRFGHRTSLFKRSQRWTILDITLALTPSRQSAPIVYSELATALDVTLGTRLAASDVAAAVVAVRRRKGMVLDPSDPDNRSVGSIFLSPSIDEDQADNLRSKGASPHTYSDGLTRVGASWLLRETGYQLGQQFVPGVRLSTKHYTLVADHGATAANFATTAAQMRQQVRQTTGVTVTFEPDLIGFAGNNETSPDLIRLDGLH
jgi:UDP-N-acetylmuramate dehydrogenase